jgi:NAD(P)-dependent dehydrogenase (short-subunit alcohol dehydrogenase family)
MNMESPLKTIALVTGANKGIGFEVARQLAASGCTVLLGARNGALGEEAAATLKREGCDVRYVSIDLDDPTTIAAASTEIEADFGHLEILVNNAGMGWLSGRADSECVRHYLGHGAAHQPLDFSEPIASDLRDMRHGQAG